ncbi:MULTISPECIES: bifunctional precorrin-2 dehydrogenase/sirohydrochlorin ferrochelatase [Bacteroides]|uniref:precorrin-2 dehydrogenase/sirohydrochlorin ferrochelatase family protein n=1 Tax=Bacteroides TaxID=816 RepID=UPI0004B18CB6|nr:bifunctional precorrin-2 dehydrogenase/sirohydrochlorin ferrochelatase [Bacteroides neonati]MCP3894061.1 bifunctional precorrin-2 dehydrogenase/sirohydrochlorin ferrochelatase [Bacteroides sp.]
MNTDNNLIFLPVSLNITGKKIVIIGGGKVGMHKATILSRFTKEATVFSPDFREGFRALPFTLIQKKYEKEDLRGVFLAYICTENEVLNRQIKQDAQELGVLASVCDNPALCDIASPAIYQEGAICISVSSNATDVRRSLRIRDRIIEWVQIDKESLK